MNDARPVDLIYGHLGEPVYDREAKKWRFPRNPSNARQINPLGPIVHALPPTRDLYIEQRSVVERTNGIKHLLKAFPEFSSAENLRSTPHQQKDTLEPMQYLLLGQAQVSEAINEVTSEHDPTQSDLIALGRVVDARSKGIHHKQLVVVASGAAGELVRFVVLGQERLGWKDKEGLYLNKWTVKGGEEGWWIGNGSPVQQVIFAGVKKEASTWLAIRYHGAISILQPVLRTSHVCPRDAERPLRQLRPSRLDTNHILTLSIQDASGAPFADVAFNPWDVHQLATVDQIGHWYIWSIEAQIKDKGLWTIVKDSQGSLVEDEDLDLDTSEPILDGWAKVLWVGDLNTLLVASRRTLAVFDVKGQPRSLEVPDLALAKNPADWILDIKRDPLDPSQCFVVTSSRLFLLRKLALGQTQTSDSVADAVMILLSWVHFRNPRDISLSLSVLDGNNQVQNPDENTSIVLLYSRSNALTTIFTFQYSRSKNSAVSICDPYCLPLKSDALLLPRTQMPREATRSSSGISCLQITRLPFNNSSSSDSEGIDDIGEQIFQLRVLYKGLAVSEQMYITSAAGSQRRISSPDTRTRYSVLKSSIKVLDDFIVTDGVDDENLDNRDPSLISEEGRRHYVQSEVTQLGEMEMGWLNEASSGAVQVSLWGRKEHSKEMPFDQYVEAIEAAIETKLGSSRPGVETIMDLNLAEIRVTDVDEASTALAKLLEKVGQPFSTSSENGKLPPEAHAIVSTSTTPAIRDALGLRDDMSIAQVYEMLIESYIRPLPPKTPGRLRIVVEKQLRNIAAQICLAAHTVRIHVEEFVHSEKTPEEESQDETHPQQGSAFALPVRGKGKESTFAHPSPSLPPPESSAPSIHTLPTTEQPATSSYRSLRSNTPSARSLRSFRTTTTTPPTSETFIEDPSSRHLAALTTLTPQPHLPPKLSNMLTHWTVGGNPADYDFGASQRATAALQDSAATPTVERSQSAKRSEKGGKRGRDTSLFFGEEGEEGGGEKATKRVDVGEREGSGGQQPVTRRMETRSQAQAVVVAQSSQVGGAGVGGSSQVLGSSQTGIGVSSQPVAGRYGGGKKVRRGRKRGF